MLVRRCLKMVEELSKKLQSISLKQAVTDDCFSVRLSSNKGSEISKSESHKLELYEAIDFLFTLFLLNMTLT